ncbi:MAG: leucine-rich repeat domain-containing protein [Bacteroidales bacterium]|jgi:hypothetical protein|nr:leucine-rich repeat domain-containing protein [Bacteroidales bacterium]
MKKIFTKRYAMAAMAAGAVIMALTATSCAKSDELSETKTDLSGEKGNVITTVRASTGGDDQTKVYFTPGDGNIFHVTWHTDDKIHVINDTQNDNTTFTYNGTDNAKIGEFKGSLSAKAGDQLFACYYPDPNTTVDWNNNSLTFVPFHSVWKIVPGEKTSASAYSPQRALMYASATAGANGTIPLFNFKNANAIIKFTFGSPIPASYNATKYLTLLSADGQFPQTGKATVYIEGGETKIKWSNLNYDEYRVSGLSTGYYDFSYSYGNVAIPGTYGPLYCIVSNDLLETASNVFYIKTDGKVSLEAGKSYSMNKPMGKAAVLSSSSVIGNLGESEVWINQLAVSDTRLRDSLYNVNSRNATVRTKGVTIIQTIPASTTDVPAIFIKANNVSYYDSTLAAYINNRSNTIPEKMFMNCRALKYVSLEYVKAIPSYTFTNCLGIESLFFPSVTTLADRALAWMPNLTKLRFGSIITDTNWYLAFGTVAASGFTVPGNIDLVLKTGQTGVSGNTFNGITFKSITFMD